jgi:hypothetical protein
MASTVRTVLFRITTDYDTVNKFTVNKFMMDLLLSLSLVNWHSNYDSNMKKNYESDKSIGTS